MNRISKIIAISAFSLIVLALPSVASAQYGGYGNGGYGNGGYGNSRYNRDIRGALQSLKHKASNFERFSNRANDRYNDRDDRWGDRDDDRWGNRNGGWGNRNGGWNNNRNLGRLEDLADSFKRATDDLLDEYGRGRDLRGSENEARRVLDLASQIDNEMNQTRNRNLRNQWNQMRNELNVVANTYGYNNRNRSGDWRNRIPFPLPF